MPRRKVVVINSESLLTSLRPHMPESLLKATQAEAQRLDDVLQELTGFVGTQVSRARCWHMFLSLTLVPSQTESGARVFINQWLIAAKRILRQEFATFVWTELCLSSASAQPVHIEEDNKTTFLTGLIDYGLASMRIITSRDRALADKQKCTLAPVASVLD